MALSSFANSAAPYLLETIYNNSNLFTEFNFFTDNDPTHGYVDYLSSAEASITGLIERLNGGVARIKVDSSSVPDDFARGRKSVRLESNTVYNHGLFIADIAHMPSSTCGLWPALWQVGPNWFRDGEVDIIEGVHEATTNLVSLHTDGNEGVCTLIPNEQNGLVGSTQCDNALTSAGGCGVSGGPFGTPFNDHGGGVYAMQWLSSGIKIWFFSRNGIPADIVSDTPNPSSWAAPVLQVGSNCDIDAHFRNMRIVIDTTFCGDWAGNVAVWQQTSCYKSNSIPSNTCIDYVKNHPEAYADGYWDINSINYYKQDTSLDSESESEPKPEPDPEAEHEAISKPPKVETPEPKPFIEIDPTEAPKVNGTLDTLEEDTLVGSSPKKGFPIEKPATQSSMPKVNGDGSNCPAHDQQESNLLNPCHYCSDTIGSVDASQTNSNVELHFQSDQKSGGAELPDVNQGKYAMKNTSSDVLLETGNPQYQYIQTSPGLKNGDTDLSMVVIMGALMLTSLTFMS